MEALDNIYSLLNQNIKTTADLIIISKKKKKTLHMQHTFLYISSLSFCTATTWKLVTRFMEERLSFVCIFILGWVDYHFFLGIPAIWQWKWPVCTRSTPEPSPMELGYKDVRKHLCGGEDVSRACAFVGASRKRLTQELDIWNCPLMFLIDNGTGKETKFPTFVWLLY